MPQESNDDSEPISVEDRNMIIISQSCDLENKKIQLAALCPYYLISEISKVDPKFAEPSFLESIRKGQKEGLHMLPSPTDSANNQSALIVDFRQIHSLPIEYLQNLAERLGKRRRLHSPFVEHLAQAFARYFMRVGLPVSIPSFSKAKN
jgi:hypothetical protein